MSDSKICFKCNVEKPLGEFYKHKQMPDGHLNKCKECNKIDVRDNRIRNIEHYREYERNRLNNQDRVNARAEYSKSEKGIEASRKAKLAWVKSNTIKRAAHHIVNNAVRDGRIVKKYQCEICSKQDSKMNAHHDDYAYPMSVRWLCSKCHSDWHKKYGSGING